MRRPQASTCTHRQVHTHTHLSHTVSHMIRIATLGRHAPYLLLRGFSLLTCLSEQVTGPGEVSLLVCGVDVFHAGGAHRGTATWCREFAAHVFGTCMGGHDGVTVLVTSGLSLEVTPHGMTVGGEER